MYVVLSLSAETVSPFTIPSRTPTRCCVGTPSRQTTDPAAYRATWVSRNTRVTCGPVR
jgi:hypothetical protein